MVCGAKEAIFVEMTSEDTIPVFLFKSSVTFNPSLYNTIRIKGDKYKHKSFETDIFEDVPFC
jgi:hypothetical protein